MPDRREAIQSALDDAHARVRAAIDQLDHPEEPMSGYDGWTKKDLVAHLISIENRLRDQVRCAIAGAVWAPEDIDSFNTRQVEERRASTIDQLRRELDEQDALSRALLGSLTEADMARPFEHPRRGKITVEDLWRIVPAHAQQHVADLDRSEVRSSTPR